MSSLNVFMEGFNTRCVTMMILGLSLRPLPLCLLLLYLLWFNHSIYLWLPLYCTSLLLYSKSFTHTLPVCQCRAVSQESKNRWFDSWLPRVMCQNVLAQDIEPKIAPGVSISCSSGTGVCMGEWFTILFSTISLVYSTPLRLVYLCLQ